MFAPTAKAEDAHIYMHIKILVNVNVLLNVTSLAVGCLTFTQQCGVLIPDSSRPLLKYYLYRWAK